MLTSFHIYRTHRLVLFQCLVIVFKTVENTFRIPALIEASNGDLLAFAEGRVGGRGDSGDIDLVLRRSSDGGDTWSDLEVVWDALPPGASSGEMGANLAGMVELLTVLEDFWGNHFNVTVPGDNIDDSRAHYAHTIRANALGTPSAPKTDSNTQ